jgi:hypothetical protein
MPDREFFLPEQRLWRQSLETLVALVWCPLGWLALLVSRKLLAPDKNDGQWLVHSLSKLLLPACFLR